MIEYATEGSGLPLLISHGAAGGYDQGLLMARPFAGWGIAAIAVSRDGYLGSPLGPNSTPESQAEKFAHLLDLLGVERAAVLAVSSGALAAIEFAFMYPHRCRGLVLVSAIIRRVSPAFVGWIPEGALTALLTSKGFTRLGSLLPDTFLLRLLGVSREQQRSIRFDMEASAALKGVLAAVRDTSGRRQPGTAADVKAIRWLRPYPFPELRVPILAIHGGHDRFAPIQDVRALAAAVNTARLIELPEGGHLCLVTHMRQVVPHVVDFLEALPP